MRKLYRVWNGNLEVVTLIREEGGIYVIRDSNGYREQCSLDMFFESEQAAWSAYMEELESAIDARISELGRLIAELNQWRDQVKVVKANILACN